MKILICLILFLVSCGGSWTKEDTALQLTYTVLHVADWNQTLQIVDSEDHEETNVILGRHPSKDEVNIYFASTLMAHYYVAHILPKPYRSYWQMVWIGIEYDVVRHNTRNGLSVNFKF